MSILKKIKLQILIKFSIILMIISSFAIFPVVYGCAKNSSNLIIENVYLTKNQYNYYSSISNSSGNNLIKKLSNLITSSHKPNPYSKVWSAISAFRDNFYQKDGKIVDIYSTKINGPTSYKFNPVTDEYHGKVRVTHEGQQYNREHIVPQSWFKKEMPMVGDANILFPTDVYVNNMRSNFYHDNVTKVEKTSMNGSKLGKNNFNKTVFEPINDFKGDIARAYFYFAIRYFNSIPENQVWKIFNKQNPYIKNPFLNTYLKWNKIDPVDAFDQARNDVINEYQGNRNPFIDIPILTDLIWNPKYKNHELIIKEIK